MAVSQIKTPKNSRITDSSGFSEKLKESVSFETEDQKKKRDLLWPEWSDTDINTENWGPVPKKTNNKLPQEKKSKASGKTTSSTKVTLTDVDLFEDPYPVQLPWSLQIEQITWVRPKVQFPNAKRVVYSQGSVTCPDIVTNNRHLLDSEFMRSFMSAVHTLCYLGYQYPFAVEWQTLQFSANTSEVPWKPWHHIYSMCKAGGNQSHNPLPNEIGKYVVRLYWLGCWRKIVVDDRYPVDATGHTLLPTTNTGNDKELDLWPALLAKALLKIASLTWTDSEEIVDFDIITCLTGWNVQKIYTKGLDTFEIWEMLKAYSDYYLYVKPNIYDEQSNKKIFEETTATNKSDKNKSKTSKTSKTKKSTGKMTINADFSQTPTSSFYIVGTLGDLRKMGLLSDEESDLYPCYAHEFLIEETKDIPLVTHIIQLEQTLAPWKLHRWLAWAKRHSICTPDPTMEKTKVLKIISNLRKTDKFNLSNLETSESEQAIKRSVDVFNQFLNEFDDPERKNLSSPKRDASEKKKKSDFIDPSIWCNFSHIGELIESISIYIKPSAFKTQYIISNLRLKGAPDTKLKKPHKPDDKKQRGSLSPVEQYCIKFICLENVLIRGKNDNPLYMFIDSIDLKPIVFTLQYLGNDFPEPEVKKHKELESGEKKFACKIGPCVEDCTCLDIKNESFLKLNFVDTRKRAHIIVETYNWKERKIGDMHLNITTCGTNSLLLDLPKGRHLYRIWLQTDSAYVMQIFSKDDFKVGKLDEILEAMTMESELFIQTYYNMCTGFGNIVRCFGTPDYPTALKEFYKSYQPNVVLNRKQRSEIHDAFIDEFINLLQKQYPSDKHNEIIKTIKILFLNPRIKIPTPTIEYSLKKEVCINNISCLCHKVDEQILIDAAIKIQSFFKMIYFRKLLEHHNVRHKYFLKFLNLTRGIYVDIFSSKVREDTCPVLLRNLTFNKNLGRLAKYFTYYNDLNSVIDLKKITGEALDFNNNVWIPLVKRVFYCKTRIPIWIKPVLYASISEYMLRIFNNDTGEEIDRLINRTVVAQYVKNEYGYTILIYGSTSDLNVKQVSWKLYLMVEKRFSISTIDMPSCINCSNYLYGNYIPNLDKLILRCLVQYKSSNISTFHLNTSSETAKIKFQCVTKEGSILAVGYGISNALLPVVNLKVSDENKSDLHSSPQEYVKTSISRDKKEKASILSLNSGLKKIKKSTVESDAHYNEVFLEAFVLEESWGLTEKEWSLVEKLRQRTCIALEILQDSESSAAIPDDRSLLGYQQFGAPRKSKLKLREILEDPKWTLTLFYDYGKHIYMKSDNQRIEEIKNLKRTCFEEPSRYYKGLNIRKQFLEDHYLKWTANKYVETESCEGEDTLNFKSHFTTNSDVDTSGMVDLKSGMSSDTKSICAECNKPLLPEEFLYLQAPESMSRMLAPFELNKANERDFAYRWPMSPRTEEKFTAKIYDSISNYEDKYNKFLSDMETYLESTRNSYNFFSQWFDDIRQDSADIMKYDEIARDNLIIKRRTSVDANKDRTKADKPKKKK